MPSVKEIYQKIDDVRIEADSVNLNVDGLEALASTQQADIALIKADVDDIRSDLANGVTINQPVAVTDNAGSLTVDGTVTAELTLDAFTGSQGGIASDDGGSEPNYGVQIGYFDGGYKFVKPSQPLPMAGTVTANAGAGTFNVSDRGATGEATVSSFTSTTSATLKSSNSSRKNLTIYNEGGGNLHVLYGSGTASTTNYSVRLSAGDYLEIDKYTGQVNAIFATAGTARVTEIT